MGVCHQIPIHGAHGEGEKFRVTKRELLNNLSNITKCNISPGGTFSLGNFLFNERELSGLIGAQREKIYIFSTDRKKWSKTGAFSHVYLGIGSTSPSPGNKRVTHVMQYSLHVQNVEGCVNLNPWTLVLVVE